MSFLPSSPGKTGLAEVFAKYPKRAVLTLRLIDDIIRGESPFTVGERELIFTYISGLNACTFCYNSHIPAATAEGIDENVFSRLQSELNNAGIDEKLVPALEFAKKLTLSPSRITQSDAEKVLRAGWDEQALVDLVSLCSVANYMNRFVNGVGVDLTASESRAVGARVLPIIGYAGWADQLQQTAAS